MTKLYKITGPNGEAIHGGDMIWSMPKGSRPGKWHKVDGAIRPYSWGLHLLDASCFGKWLTKIDCRIFEAETKGSIIEADNKYVAQQARLLKEVPGPDYWAAAKDFIASIKDVPFLKPQCKPKKKWKVFDSRAAARAAAWAAAGNAAWNAAWDAVWVAAWVAGWVAARATAGSAAGTAAWAAAGNAAWVAARDAARATAGDAELMSQVLICTGLPLKQKHINHAKARWEVWQSGYGLLCDIGGIFYVYKSL